MNQLVDKDIAKIQEFYSRILAVRCHKCQSSITRDLDPKRHLADWSNALAGNGPSGSRASICAVACPKMGCRTSTCLGCGKKPALGVHTADTDAGQLDWCCDRGRLFAIWIFLARYDQVELKMQETESRKKESHSPQKKDSKGIGYVSNTGFDDPFALLNEFAMGGVRAVQAINFQCADTLTDGVLGQLLTLITRLLPSRHQKPNTAFDEAPSSTLLAALRLGLLIDKVAQLLRNDSIADISKRSSVYFPALEFVKVLGTHRATEDLVTQERYYKRGTSGLQLLSMGGAYDPKGKGKARSSRMLALGDAQDGNAPSLVNRLDNLVKQSQIMLGLGKGSGGRREMRSEADRISLELCEMIVKVHTRVGANFETLEDDLNMLDVNTKSETETAKAWTAYHREACFELTEAAMQGHFWAPRQAFHSPKGRIPYLMKEMASMATSLPEGIFVKASAETPGFLKCLIVGPEDTPYENGLFAFDIGAGPDYPDMPPHAFFRGTHGGLADMNPNLHPDGKVCLSLLGTFDGPVEAKWQARKSTILSVLVSIQGMILTTEPWRNEPGNGDANNAFARRACRQYNLDRMALTVRFAMLPWLLDAAWRDGIWRDVVDHHFRLHGRKMVRTVRAWARVSPGIESFREPRHVKEGVKTYTAIGGRNILKLLEGAIKDSERRKG